MITDELRIYVQILHQIDLAIEQLNKGIDPDEVIKQYRKTMMELLELKKQLLQVDRVKEALAHEARLARHKAGL